VERLEKRFKQVQQDLAVLAQQPDNAAANLAVGESYCFALQRWEQGLPYLAKGSDAALAELPRRDLGAPPEPEARMELGDRWWDLAKEQQGEDRTAMMSRAAHWYEAALPGLTDLSKTSVEKRLEEFAAMTADEASPGKPKGKFALAFDGQKSHVLVSFAARYAADYTPAVRLEKDKATELLFNFDEGAGNVAHDSSGNKHHGKIVEAQWVKRQ